MSVLLAGGNQTYSNVFFISSAEASIVPYHVYHFGLGFSIV